MSRRTDDDRIGHGALGGTHFQSCFAASLQIRQRLFQVFSGRGQFEAHAHEFRLTLDDRDAGAARPMPCDRRRLADGGAGCGGKKQFRRPRSRRWIKRAMVRSSRYGIGFAVIIVAGTLRVPSARVRRQVCVLAVRNALRHSESACYLNCLQAGQRRLSMPTSSRIFLRSLSTSGPCIERIVQ